MNVQERINQELVASMKAKDTAVLSTLRMLKSALKNKQIDVMHELSEEEVLAVVKSQIKQLIEAKDIAQKAQREEMAQRAQEEIALLERYLPAQMDDATLATKVKDALAQAGFTSKADIGRAMGVAMKAVAGQADGSRVKAIVESVLTCWALALVFSLFDASAALAATSAEASANYLLPTLRIARSFLLLLGLVAVNFVAIGGFMYMTASGRDETHEHATEKMGFGLFATIAIAALFAIVTNVIEQLS